MKTVDCDISIQNLSKIEGHADLDVKVRRGKVQSVHIKLQDNKRFFTTAVIGRKVEALPDSTSRICGTCSIAHQMGCIECIENALGVKPSKQTKLLKQLSMHGLMIRDHALHIYLFSLPDVFNKDSVLDFEGDELSYVKDSFVIKKCGSTLCNIVAGRAVHAPHLQAGGFTEPVDNKKLKAMIPKLKKARKVLKRVLKVYAESPIDYTRETKFVSLVGEFDYLTGPILSSHKKKILQKDYFDHLEKTVLPYSQAVGYKFEGDTYMVGALARLNLNKEKLHPKTKKDCAAYLKFFPSNNIFHNNLAQGIEIMHSIDCALDIITSTTFRPEKPKKLTYKKSVGVAAIEAPRGLLFYRLDIGKNGKVNKCTIITPTQQNQVNIELDVKNLVERALANGTKKAQIHYDIEKLIRSYDPCISCATHFLKINWV